VGPELKHLVCDPISFVGGPWLADADLVRGRGVNTLYRYFQPSFRLFILGFWECKNGCNGKMQCISKFLKKVLQIVYVNFRVWSHLTQANIVEHNFRHWIVCPPQIVTMWVITAEMTADSDCAQPGCQDMRKLLTFCGLRAHKIAL